MDWEQFETQLKQDQSAIEATLHARFQDSARYADLTEAMEYSLLAGKRIGRCSPWSAAACAAETRRKPWTLPVEWRWSTPTP